MDREVVKRFSDPNESMNEVQVLSRKDGSLLCTCTDWTPDKGCQHVERIRSLEKRNQAVFGDSYVPTEAEMKSLGFNPRRFQVLDLKVSRRVHAIRAGRKLTRADVLKAIRL